MGETLNRVEQLINDALTTGDLPAAGPTRVGQLLAALQSDVNTGRRSLAAFGGYREQTSLDTYLGQLSDYVQSINESLTRPAAVDARRLAVAMQGVVGRLQNDADSLEPAGRRRRHAAAAAASRRRRPARRRHRPAGR